MLKQHVGQFLRTKIYYISQVPSQPLWTAIKGEY